MFFLSLLQRKEPSAIAIAPVPEEIELEPIPLSPYNTEVSASAHAIFLNELTYIKYTLKQDCSKWFQDKTFLEYFAQYIFRILPTINNPYEIYFAERKVNELFIYMCQELARQLSYFLQNNAYPKNCSAYCYPKSIPTDDKTAQLGITDFSRISPTRVISECGRLASLSSSTNSSMDEISSDISTIQVNFGVFNWQSLLPKITETFNKTYDNVTQESSKVTP